MEEQKTPMNLPELPTRRPNLQRGQNTKPADENVNAECGPTKEPKPNRAATNRAEEKTLNDSTVAKSQLPGHGPTKPAQRPGTETGATADGGKNKS